MCNIKYQSAEPAENLARPHGDLARRNGQTAEILLDLIVGNGGNHAACPVDLPRRNSETVEVQRTI